MKITILCILTVAIGAISCNKISQSNLPGSWALGENTTGAYSAIGSTVTNTLIASNDFPPDPDSLFFYFNTYPTASGSYKIVGSKTPAAGQVGMVYTSGLPPNTQYIVPSPTVTASASVSVSNGKVSIHIPLIQVMTDNNAGDTTTFVANIYQTL